MVEWGRLGVLVARAQARVGSVKDVEALRERGHHPVLDPVVNHLHEVPCADGPAVEVAALLCGRLAAASGCSGRRLDTGCERGEDRLQRREGLFPAADHQAEPAVEAEDAAARAAVEVVDTAS